MSRIEEPILVTIYCITYNHKDYLRQCLDGFVMQKTNFRYVAEVHDDCSTDGTTDILREYAAKYPDIIYPIYEEENQYQQGKMSEISRKLREVSNRFGAKYIAECEGDDYWTDPLKLQKQVDFLEEHEEYVMCYTDYDTVDSDNHKFDWYNHPLNIARSFTGDNFRELLKGNYIQTMTMLYRTSVVRNPDYRSGIDYALSMGCALFGKCAFLKDKTACYRIHDASVTHTATGIVGAASMQAWEDYVDLYLSSPKYKRDAWEHMLICGTIDACLISKERSGDVQKEQADRVLKNHPELKKYMWLGVLYRTRHTIMKRFK